MTSYGYGQRQVTTVLSKYFCVGCYPQEIGLSAEGYVTKMYIIISGKALSHFSEGVWSTRLRLHPASLHLFSFLFIHRHVLTLHLPNAWASTFLSSSWNLVSWVSCSLGNYPRVLYLFKFTLSDLKTILLPVVCLSLISSSS